MHADQIPDLSVPDPSPDDVRSLRERFGLTQAEMAELLGGNQAKVSEFEKGTRSPLPNNWQLALLRLGEHPTYRLVKKTGGKRSDQPKTNDRAVR